MQDLIINSRIKIPSTDLLVTHARSSGPGGQNVNKVNTKVTLQWRISGNQILTSPWTERIAKKHASRISSDGMLLISSQRYRKQLGNLNDCLNKLRAIILECQYAPTKRIASRPTLGSKKRRLEGKRRNSEKKRDRGQKWDR